MSKIIPGATPGPWRRAGLFGTKIMSADGLTEICDTYPSGPADQTSEEEAVANAKLIVAVYGLYEVLDAMLIDVLASAEGYLTPQQQAAGDESGIAEDAPDLYALIIKARAALAEARGE